MAEKEKLFSGLVCHVVWQLETNISEAVLSPSSSLKFVTKEIYLPHCCLSGKVPDA
jgi:hypothetical protein